MAEKRVTVRAPARLHLGFLDPGGGSARRFGSIGLALSEPETRITVERTPADSACGPAGERALAYLVRLRERLGLDGGHRISVDEAIPPHTGLGSGTQIALAAAAGLRAVEGLPADIRGDCARLERGARSGLGAAFMETGGVAVDGGKGPPDAPPPIVANLAFPPEWRVVLVFDTRTEGFHGQDELDAFAALPAFPEARVAEICRLVLMQALPALAERDIAPFGAAIARVQRMVGEHFAPAQGGVFTSARVAGALETLAAAGAHGIGQSSWGPTGFCFAETADAAESLTARLATEMPAGDVTTRIVTARTTGATIERADPAAGRDPRSTRPFENA